MNRNVTLLAAAIAAGGVVFATIARRQREKQEPPTQPEADPIDQASDDSFPASDPPAWTGTTAHVEG